MNKKNSIRKILAAGATAMTMPLFAYWTPIQINIADVAGLPPAADSVYGIRVNAIYGTCETAAVFDVGLFNRTTKGAYGIRAGAFNWAEQDGYGLTVGAINVDQHNAGLTAGAFNYAKDGAGVAIGVFNFAETFSGLQISAINIASKNFTGVQIGALNFNFNSVVPVFPVFNMGSK